MQPGFAVAAPANVPCRQAKEHFLRGVLPEFLLQAKSDELLAKEEEARQMKAEAGLLKAGAKRSLRLEKGVRSALLEDGQSATACKAVCESVRRAFLKVRDQALPGGSDLQAKMQYVGLVHAVSLSQLPAMDGGSLAAEAQAIEGQDEGAGGASQALAREDVGAMGDEDYDRLLGSQDFADFVGDAL